MLLKQRQTYQEKTEPNEGEIRVREQNREASRKPDIEPVVYNIPEIASMLDIHLIGAYELAKRKGFPSVRIGRRIVVPKEAFHRWLEGEAVG
ncbi:MAG TPA: helix-turn-helix domain-containing protein [Firmicutes bacterium]|nr:helix-turn-helix domain-containing protein [Candidatus Fermentithermobacillaceae bacterium]